MFTSPRLDMGGYQPSFDTFEELQSYSVSAVLFQTLFGTLAALTYKNRVLCACGLVDLNTFSLAGQATALYDVNILNFQPITFFSPQNVHPDASNHSTLTISNYVELSQFRTKLNKAIRSVHAHYFPKLSSIRSASTVQEVEDVLVTAFAHPYNVPGYPQQTWSEFVPPVVPPALEGVLAYHFPIDNL